MKKLVTLLIAAGLLIGMGSSSARAVELKASGTYEFGFSWSDTALERHDSADTFHAVQRVRPQFDFIVSENLRATLQMEIGDGLEDGSWGGQDWGMGADATNVRVRFAYLDWTVPNTDLKVRMGLQNGELPSYTFSTVFAVEVAGITLSYAFNDNVDLTVGWYRPYNVENTPHDSFDVALASLPVKGDGFVVNPWVMYARSGKAALDGALNSPNSSNGSELSALWSLLPDNVDSSMLATLSKTNPTGWWVGMGGEWSALDPLTLALDVVYGSFDAGSVNGFDIKRAGWMISALASYKLDCMTPGLIAWYASGDDSNPNNGSEKLPAIYGDAWGTNFGQDGGWYDAASLTTDLSGSWGIGLRLDDISFVEKLSHNLRFTYYQGTNNKNMVKAGHITSPTGNGYGNFYLTTSDRAWEFNLENSYQIYKNLSANFELGYVKLDLDEGVWGGRADQDDKMYKAGLYLTYSF